MLVLGVLEACLAGASPAAADTPVAGPTGDASAEAKAAPAVKPDARKAHNEALASLRKGDVEEAFAGFTAAWSLQGLPRVPRIAGNLGRAELALGKHRDAAEHLAFFLREEPDLSEKDRSDFGQLLTEAKTKVGVLHVELREAGAEIAVDGVSVGTSPMAVELYVEAGQRKITAKLGELVATKSLDVGAGTTSTVRLALAPPKPAPPVPPVTAPTEPVAPAARSRVPGFVMGGAGVIALGAGAGLLAAHLDRRGQAERLHDEIASDAGHCRPGPAAHASCAKLESTARDADTLRGAGTALVIGGGIVAAAGGAYLLWARKASTQGNARRPAIAPALQVNVLASGGGGALLLTGEF